MLSRALALTVFSIAFVGCDSADVTEPPPDAAPTVRVEGRVGLSPRIVNAYLSRTGLVGDWQTLSDSSALSGLRAGALWMAGQQGGTLRATGGTAVSAAPCDDVADGVYIVDADTAYAAEGWPATAGAPATVDGAPRAYGDEMAWASVCSQATRRIDQTFDGLRVNAALFGYDALPHVVFVRYEVRNESALAISDAYAGFWADVDLTPYGYNLAGLDRDDRLGYTYLSPLGPTGEPFPDRARGYVGGVQILETPGGAPFAAARITDKNGGPFGEDELYGAAAFSNALRGLSNDGAPMVDPTTGAPSAFAYTGDPVGRTGWLDGFDSCGSACRDDVQTGEDVRQLLSAGPFSLAPGEATTLTVAFLAHDVNGLRTGLDRLRQDAARLRADASLWRFPIAD